MSGDDDRKRFADVVMPHLGDAYSLAHWLTGNAADAEDVVQEACVRALRAIGGHSGNARAWTLTVVRHTAYSWLAKNRRRTVVAVDDLEAVERAQVLPGKDSASASPATPETELIANVVTSPHHLSATMVTGREHRMTEVFGRLAPGAQRLRRPRSHPSQSQTG